MWGGFAIFWETTAIVGGAGAVFVIWGIPFVTVGLYLLVGRLFVRRRMRAQTNYAVTDRRVLVLAPMLRGGRRTTSVWFRAYPPVERSVRPDGEGSITIGTLPLASRWIAADPSWPGSYGRGSAVVLADIEDADQVYAQIMARIGAETKGG